MTNPNADDTIPGALDTIQGLMKIDRQRLSFEENMACRDATQHLLEASSFDTIAMALNSGDAAFAYRLLKDRTQSSFPQIHKVLVAAAFSAMQAKPNAQLAGGCDDVRRENTFAQDPERFLPGATPAQVAIKPPGIHFVYLNGKLTPWTYGAQAYAASDVDEMAEYMERAGFERGFVVGAPSVSRLLRLRDGVEFVAVTLPEERAA